MDRKSRALCRLADIWDDQKGPAAKLEHYGKGAVQLTLYLPKRKDEAAN